MGYAPTFLGGKEARSSTQKKSVHPGANVERKGKLHTFLSKGGQATIEKPDGKKNNTKQNNLEKAFLKLANGGWPPTPPHGRTRLKKGNEKRGRGEKNTSSPQGEGSVPRLGKTGGKERKREERKKEKHKRKKSPFLGRGGGPGESCTA